MKSILYAIICLLAMPTSSFACKIDHKWVKEHNYSKHRLSAWRVSSIINIVYLESENEVDFTMSGHIVDFDGNESQKVECDFDTPKDAHAFYTSLLKAAGR